MDRLFKCLFVRSLSLSLSHPFLPNAGLQGAVRSLLRWSGSLQLDSHRVHCWVRGAAANQRCRGECIHGLRVSYVLGIPSFPYTHTDLDTLASGHIGIAGLHANQTLRFVAEVVGRLNGVTGTPVIASENLLYTNAQSYLFGSCSASYAATQYGHMLTVDSKLGETGAPHDQ